MKATGDYIYGYPLGGCISLHESLAKVIRAKGNRVWTRSRVQRILVENGVARGILVNREGEDIEVGAGAVISDAGPQVTVDLGGKEKFDKGHLRDVRAMRPMPYISIHVISNRPLIETPALLFLTGGQVLDYVCAPTLTCEGLAPKGKHMLVVGGSAVQGSGGPIDFRKVVQQAIQDLEENIPGMEKHGQILHVSCYRRAWPDLRTVPGTCLPRKTSIEKLYNVGDGVAPSGSFGHVGSLLAAREVVTDVQTRLRPGEHT
jgi:phytoene dehydrogenase-like protein